MSKVRLPVEIPDSGFWDVRIAKRQYTYISERWDYLLSSRWCVWDVWIYTGKGAIPLYIYKLCKVRLPAEFPDDGFELWDEGFCYTSIWKVRLPVEFWAVWKGQYQYIYKLYFKKKVRLPVEFSDDGFELREVGSVGRVLGPATSDDVGQLVTRTVVLLQRGAEVRFESVTYLAVDLCTDR